MVADYTRSSEGAIAKTEAKKNLRKTQVGVNRVNQPKLIPPINTSGISTLAIHNASLLTDNRNSLRQSVTKDSDYHYSDMTGRVTITPRGMFCFTFAEDAHPLPLNARRFSATLVSV